MCVRRSIEVTHGTCGTMHYLVRASRTSRTQTRYGAAHVRYGPGLRPLLAARAHRAAAVYSTNRTARVLTMPKLLDEMERYLDRWQGDLPTAWRKRLDGVAPDLDAIPRDASLDLAAEIVPLRQNRCRVFYALEGIDPADVNAVILGNDPYPDPIRATGRSFEQGDLIDWTEDLGEPGRVTRSLLSLVCAVAALRADAKAPALDSSDLCDRRGKLLCGLQRARSCSHLPGLCSRI